MNSTWGVLLPFFVFFVVFFLFGGLRPKVCPECHEKLPFYCSPFAKTKRQWIEGGYVCRNCGCETDVSGKKVPAGAALHFRSFYLHIGLLTLALLPTFALLTWVSRPSTVPPPLVAKPQHISPAQSSP